MKRVIIFIALLATVAINAIAQPQKFNYQGIARNPGGQPLANQLIGVEIAILDGSATGNEVYKEVHATTTNTFGLYTLQIGNGTVVSGSMGAILWGSGDKYLRCGIDPAGGTNYTSLAATQLLSVPYALYAASGTPGPAGPQGPTGAQGPAGLISLPYINSITTTSNASVFELTNLNTITGAGTIRAFASSPNAPALSGANTSNGGAGVYGAAIGPAGKGVYGTGNFGIEGSGSSYGGVFWGPVGIQAGSNNVPTGGAALEINGGIKVVGSSGKMAFTILGQTSTSGASGYISGNTMLINNPFCNNQPNAILIVTHNWSTNNNSTYINKPIGVYYSGGSWRVFTEDGSPMPATAFNVLVFNQ